jgi:hypothetical protein
MAEPCPPGKRLERLVAAIHHAESQGGVVTWNDHIQGRQFDVTIRFSYGMHDYLTVIECKDYSSKVPVEKVDAFATKSRDAKANKAILISSKGFQSGCFDVAERHKIELLVLTETTSIDVSELAARFTPGLNLFDVCFDNTNTNETTQLEDWGGRLSYLMKHSTVLLPTGSKTPNQLVDEWQASSPTLNTDKENSVEIILPSGTELQIPHEETRQVNRMRFGCALITLAIPKRPVLDNHIRAAMATQVELRNHDSSLRHSMPLSRIPLGFDAVVQVGRFYEQPSLFNRYYCDQIDGDTIRWKLVESYQHGHLLQAVFKQKAEYSKYYEEVTDPSVLQRLRQMLEKLDRKR